MDSDWSSLPLHLLDKILERTISNTNYRDYVQFDVVCSSWHSVTKKNKTLWQHVKSLSHHHVPLLLIPNEDIENHSHCLYDVMTSSFLESKIIVPFDKRFAGSSHGWLVGVDKDSSVTLYKPYYLLTGDETMSRSMNTTSICLPPLIPVEYREAYADKADYHVRKALITADPLVNEDECVVVVVLSFVNRLAYIRPAKDTKWTYVQGEDINLGYADVVYLEDQFYFINHSGELLSFQISDESLDIKFVASATPGIIGNRYLVESAGKLLQVGRWLAWPNDDDDDDTFSDDEGSRSTFDVTIYELDLNGKRWIEIENLGDVALFLGDNASISVVASNFKGCKPNCIYFTHDQDAFLSCQNESVCDFGVYDLQSNGMDREFDMDEHSFPKISNRIPIWIAPFPLYQI